MNWGLNIVIFVLIIGSYVANRQADYGVEKALVGVLVPILGAPVLYGVLKLKSMQLQFDLHKPQKEPKAPAV